MVSSVGYQVQAAKYFNFKVQSLKLQTSFLTSIHSFGCHYNLLPFLLSILNILIFHSVKKFEDTKPEFTVKKQKKVRTSEGDISVVINYMYGLYVINIYYIMDCQIISVMK
jgi:quinol-cytochrome oxidoreductase complex cytochrome b subunit